MGNFFLDKNLKLKIGDFGLAIKITKEKPLRKFWYLLSKIYFFLDRYVEPQIICHQSRLLK